MELNALGRVWAVSWQGRPELPWLRQFLVNLSGFESGLCQCRPQLISHCLIDIGESRRRHLASEGGGASRHTHTQAKPSDSRRNCLRGAAECQAPTSRLPATHLGSAVGKQPARSAGGSAQNSRRMQQHRPRLRRHTRFFVRRSRISFFRADPATDVRPGSVGRNPATEFWATPLHLGRRAYSFLPPRLPHTGILYGVGPQHEAKTHPVAPRRPTARAARGATEDRAGRLREGRGARRAMLIPEAPQTDWAVHGECGPQLSASASAACSVVFSWILGCPWDTPLMQTRVTSAFAVGPTGTRSPFVVRRRSSFLGHRRRRQNDHCRAGLDWCHSAEQWRPRDLAVARRHCGRSPLLPSAHQVQLVARIEKPPVAPDQLVERPHIFSISGFRTPAF